MHKFFTKRWLYASGVTDPVEPEGLRATATKTTASPKSGKSKTTKDSGGSSKAKTSAKAASKVKE